MVFKFCVKPLDKEELLTGIYIDENAGNQFSGRITMIDNLGKTGAEQYFIHRNPPSHKRDKHLFLKSFVILITIGLTAVIAFNYFEINLMKSSIDRSFQKEYIESNSTETQQVYVGRTEKYSVNFEERNDSLPDEFIRRDDYEKVSNTNENYSKPQVQSSNDYLEKEYPSHTKDNNTDSENLWKNEEEDKYENYYDQLVSEFLKKIGSTYDDINEYTSYSYDDYENADSSYRRSEEQPLPRNEENEYVLYLYDEYENTDSSSHRSEEQPLPHNEENEYVAYSYDDYENAYSSSRKDEEQPTSNNEEYEYTYSYDENENAESPSHRREEQPPSNNEEYQYQYDGYLK